MLEVLGRRRKPKQESETAPTTKQLFADIQELAPQYSDGYVVFTSATLSNRLTRLSGQTMSILPFRQGDPTHVYFTRDNDDKRTESLRLSKRSLASDTAKFHIRDKDFRVQRVSKGDFPEMEFKPTFQEHLQFDFDKIIVAIREDLELARGSWRQSVREERDDYLNEHLPSIHKYAKDRIVSVLVNIQRAFGDQEFVVVGEVKEPKDREEGIVDLRLNLPINEQVVERLEKARRYHPTVNHEKTYTRDFSKNDGIYTIKYTDGLTIRLISYDPSFVLGNYIVYRGDGDDEMSPLEKDFERYLENRQKHFYGLVRYSDHGFRPIVVNSVLLLASPNEDPGDKIFEDLKDY